MKILGLNAYHGDSSAALVIDGQLIAAAEEERFRRVKHWAGFPSKAIHYCLTEAGIDLAAVDHVAVNSDPQANLLRKIWYTLGNRPDPRLVLDRLRNAHERGSVSADLAKAFPSEDFLGQIHHVEHHLCHLASAFLVSPFRKAVTLSVDGFGDFASVAWGVGRGSDLAVDGRVFFPHSLGIFYQALTQYLGFPHYGDEYKVMGLAPYGRPRYLDAMRRIVQLQNEGGFKLDLSYFRHHREKIQYRWKDGPPEVGVLYSPALDDLLGSARRSEQSLEDRHRDLACSVQAMYEEAFFHLLDHLHKTYGIHDIALAGGCAMNSVANGKIRRRSPFRRVYIQAAAGDAGGAIGAALSIARNHGAGRCPMPHAYWGPGFDDHAIEILLGQRAEELETQGCRASYVVDEGELCRQTALAVAQAKVVGWFQGRMEWGPRALGNRSIVCDPRQANVKDILNLKIKRRESFRPFAPSILRETVGEWFEEDDDVPFMMKVFQVRKEKRALIPAVTHVDGSGRLQTVCMNTNPRYYRLISAFFELTGVPLLLNTSFNENEPVVCLPEEALNCFLRTHMDALVMGRWIVMRT